MQNIRRFFPRLCWLLAICYWLCPGVAAHAGTFAVQWQFRDSISNVLAVKEAWITPLNNYGVDGSILITGDRITKRSAADGSLIVSNLFNGRCYAVELHGPWIHTKFTNCFSTNVTGLVNGADSAYLTAPIRDNGILAYSQIASDLRYLHTNVGNYVLSGTNVTFVTNAAGQLTISSTGAGSAYSQAAADLRFLRTNVDQYILIGTNLSAVTNGSGQLTLSATAASGGSTNEIFSSTLSTSVSAAATSVTLDRAAAFPATIAGHLCIGFGTTNAEIRSCSTVTGAIIGFTRPLTFAHAAGERVTYFSGDTADAAWWGLSPNSSVDVSFPLTQAIYEVAQEDLWLNGGGAYWITHPLVAPPSARIQNITINAKAGYTGVGHTNAYMLWSSQGARHPFTATAVDDTITTPATWNPPAGDATNSIVVFYGLGGTALPAPLSNGIPYYVHAYTSTTMKLGLSTNVAEIINITGNGTGYMYTEVGSLHRLYLRDVYLNGGAHAGLNGIYASMQQPAYWAGFVRLNNFGGIGVKMTGQDMTVERLQIGVCGVGLDLTRDYGQNSGMQFLQINSYNCEEYTNALRVGGAANYFGTIHLETPLSDVHADIDGSVESGYLFVKNFFVTHGIRTNTVFKMGSADNFASVYDIEQGYASAAADADTLLLDDQYRHRKIFAYKAATGALRSFSHLQSFPVPDSASFSDMWGGNTAVGLNGRFYHLGMAYGPWLRIGAGTNDYTDLFQMLRSDGTTNSSFNANGDFVSRSNASAGYVLTSDANGLGTWQAPVGGDTFTNNPGLPGVSVGLGIGTNLASLALAGVAITNNETRNPTFIPTSYFQIVATNTEAGGSAFTSFSGKRIGGHKIDVGYAGVPLRTFNGGYLEWATDDDSTMTLDAKTNDLAITGRSINFLASEANGYNFQAHKIISGNGSGLTNLSNVALLNSASNYLSGNLTVNGDLAVNGSINFEGDVNIANLYIGSASSGVLVVKADGQMVPTNTLYGVTMVAPNLGTIASGNGLALTNLSFDVPTNTYTINTAFPLGQTNQFLTAGSVTGGITGIANGPSSTDRFGVLEGVATGTFIFTNPASIHTSDFLTSRTITNGNTFEIAIKVTPGRSTNMAIVQFR